jgi:hypothetical protein
MKNAVSGVGLAPDVAMVTFPIPMFLPGSDISSLKERRREFYDGLTRWKSEFAQAAGSARMISVEGATYEDALVKANNLLLTNLWGDGLPLWPATKERVDWILRGSTLPRTHVLGKFPPRGGITTIETCAIALAMAGGRPEYLPVLVAAVDACLAADGFDQLQATSGGPFPAVIVNGPIAKQIRLNSGFGLLGPDPQRPAGASIGRALRLLQQNLGGALPGLGTMANYGGLRYTNVVFAEDEANVPAGWPSHATERHGIAPGQSSISLVFANGAANIRRRGAKKETPEEDALQGMHRMADFMRVPNMPGLAGYEHGTPGILMIPGVVAQTMASLGWTKPSIREFLFEHSRIPAEHLRRAGCPAWIEIDASKVVRESIHLDPWPITASADNFIVVVAGGGHPTNSYWLQGYSPGVVARLIEPPPALDALLAEAERELGPR